MPSRSFEQLPRSDAFTPDSSPARSRAWRNLRSSDVPSAHRPGQVDRLSDSYADNNGAEDINALLDARTHLPSNVGLPETRFSNPDLEEPDLALEREYQAFLAAEKQRVAHQLAEKKAEQHRLMAEKSRERLEAFRNGRESDASYLAKAREGDLKRARARLDDTARYYGMKDGAPSSWQYQPKTETLSHEELNDLLDREQNLDTWERVQNGETLSDPQDTTRALRGFANRYNRPDVEKRVDHALAENEVRAQYRQQTEARKAATAAAIAEAQESRRTSRSRMEASMSLKKEAHAWKRAEQGFKPKTVTEATDAVLGFANTYNRPDFAKRAEAIIGEGPQIREVPEFDEEDIGQVISKEGPIRSPRTPRVLESPAPRPAPVERRPIGADLASMLDSMEQQLGNQNQEAYTERALAPRESMSTELDLEKENATYARQLEQEKRVRTCENNLAQAKRVEENQKADIANIDSEAKKAADAFREAFNIDIVDAVNGKLGLAQRMRLALRKWTSSETDATNPNPAALIETYKAKNQEALEMSAALQEKQEEIRDLVAEVERAQMPANPNADHERAQARAQQMTGRFRDRQTVREQKTSGALGMRAEMDTRLGFGSDEGEPKQPSYEAAKRNFKELAGFDELEAAEAAEELITGVKRQRATETKVTTSLPAEAPPSAPEEEDSFDRFSRVFIKLQSDSENGFGESFSRLKNLTLKDANKLISEAVRAQQEKILPNTSPESVQEVIDLVCERYETMRRSKTNDAWKTTQPADFFYGIDQRGKIIKVSMNGRR